MKWFLDLTMRGKLFVSFGLIIAFMVAVIATAHIGVKAIQDSQKTLYRKDFANVVDLLNIRSNINGIRAGMLSMMLTAQRSDQEIWRQDIKQRSQQVSDAVQRLLTRNRNNQQISAKLEAFKAEWTSAMQTRATQTIPLIRAGKIEQAKAQTFDVQNERQRRMRAFAQQLGDEALEHARLAVTASERQADAAVRVFVIAGFLAALLGIALVLFLNRIIASPLRTVSDYAERVAAGDLTVNLPLGDRGDEVGTLMRTFHTMIENLRRTTHEINEGVGVLAASSSEILATTTQVAAGAAETATAVSQTSATVEEVKQTAQLASQKAKYVSESAQKASSISQTGRKSAEAVIQGMHSIQEQMASIAESIVRLSEQSHAIGEIISAVNDLAEQSNLLAVNAAIEASKAGEQGKGFAVVAQEIRNLAEQSRQATAQIRTLLGDIQKATGAAVLATEQGSKAVEKGATQSQEAGESIRLLADSAAEAAQAAIQIAASSQQQMAGMDQIAYAMENIKQASMQNVAGTRQTEAAAQQLHELGQRLKQLAAHNKV